MEIHDQIKVALVRAALSILLQIPIEEHATPAEWAKREDPEALLYRAILLLESYGRRMDPQARILLR